MTPMLRHFIATTTVITTILTAQLVNPLLASSAPDPSEIVPGLEYVGGDEFDGPAGFSPSQDFWSYDLGGGGWGNDEKQIYTDSRANSYLDGKGNLVISAQGFGDSVTSARITTKDKADFTFGLLEARIKMPEGQGIHPAMWLVGTNMDRVGWPEAGEIDCSEIVNTGSYAHNGIHGPWFWPTRSPWKLSSGVQDDSNLSSGFHTYSIYRQPGSIQIAIDGNEVGYYSAANIPLGAKWVFDGPMYLILNIATGGEWPGPTPENAPVSAQMIVDWVRYSV
ncbi:MAG: glycoside hydrolase family 16 protein [Mycobacteriaceae bacterium]